MIDLDDYIFGSQLTEPVLPRYSSGRFRGRYACLMYIAAISSGPGRSLRSRRLLRFALVMTRPQGLLWI
jgi:hypothetical protein